MNHSKTIIFLVGLLFSSFHSVGDNHLVISKKAFTNVAFSKVVKQDIVPKLLWSYSGIGNGYSSPAIKGDNVFVTGEIEGMGYLFALDKSGKLLWRKQYGKEWTKQFGGTRAAPTIKDNLIYVCSGHGKIVCFEALSGQIKWSVDMIEDFGGQNIVYGYSMNLIAHKNLLYCLPGGKENNIVALNRINGKIEWSSKGNGELAGYASPIVFNMGKRNLLVLFSEYALIGLDAKTGELLWSHNLDDMGEIPCNTPIFEDGFLYYVAGPGNGAVKLKLSNDGNKINEVWKNVYFDTYYGGIIKLNNHIYGTLEGGRMLSRLNLESGKIDDGLKIGKGSITTDGQTIFYYSERGEVFLINQEEGKMKTIASFKINKGSKEHFAHPIVANDKLYIRHGNSIMVYTIGDRR